VKFDLNIFSIIVMITSIVLVLYPLAYMWMARGKAQEVAENFKTIEFALRHFFYNEGFGVVSPSKVGVDTLYQRYYLKKKPKDYYYIIWVDPDPSDGRIEAAVVYRGKLDPVAAVESIKGLVWLDEEEGKLYQDYRDWRQPAVVVEVVGD